MISLATDTERAWAAGFFDGEGFTGCYATNTNKHEHLIVSISQTEPQTLERFQRAIGGLGESTVRTIGIQISRCGFLQHLRLKHNKLLYFFGIS